MGRAIERLGWSWTFCFFHALDISLGISRLPLLNSRSNTTAAVNRLLVNDNEGYDTTKDVTPHRMYEFSTTLCTAVRTRSIRQYHTSFRLKLVHSLCSR